MSDRHPGTTRIKSFDFEPGRRIAGKYRVLAKLGVGWEGEVYLVAETRTAVERAAKLFYPHRNLHNRAAKFYAKRLHALRHCPLVIQYHAEESITVRWAPVTVLISEYVEGDILSRFLLRRLHRRMGPFEALHLLHALVRGMEQVHAANEYHGDIHSDNIVVNRHGLTFNLRLLDFFHRGSSKIENKRSDVCDVVAVFHEVLGGGKHYASQPDAVKYICCGLKRSLIVKRFRTVTRLREHLEKMDWG